MSKLENPAQFALAGNAVFTLQSKKTGARFTYRVRAAETGPMHFVQVLTGPDNTQDYRYLGFLRRGVYFHGGLKAKIAKEAPSAKAFDWFWRHMAANAQAPDSVDVHHEGRCGRCGRPLTVPESIQSGFGPECITKVF
jgi:hypothetical protein